MSTKLSANPRMMRSWQTAACALTACLLVSTLSGCTALTQPINGVPAKRLPPDFFPEPKNDLVPVDISILSIEPPRDYQISAGDILGVYLEGVLPFNPPNQPPAPPPVNFPSAESTLPPSIGYPIPVQDDGTLSLPLVEPLHVDGLTLDQVRDAIRDVYLEADILRPDKARPIVTVIQERTYDVIVIREDTSGGGGGGGGALRGSDFSATGGLVKLRAYQNDILHALVQTGGLPGLNAKNEVKILRASEADQKKRADFLRAFYAQLEAAKMDPCACPPKLPDDPTILRIPLRVKPGVVPEISKEDVRLEDGDIVYIESRETEVFYTGGLLGGGEHTLPRDYDLDVLAALSIAGGTVAAPANRGGGGGGGMGGGGFGLEGRVPPGLLYVLRKTDCGGQIAIEVDLAEAINNPRARILVQPGDYLILQYKCEEQLLNFGLATFFTYGVAELFRGRN
jgi:protein involved in polysaccharide export with SLBB domain